MRDFMRRRLWDALVVLAAVAVALGVRAALAPSGASAATRGQWGDLLGYGALEEALSFIASGGDVIGGGPGWHDVQACQWASRPLRLA